ncbi:MAG: redox-sensing transcriptional repressor Rex [Thermoleophilia bacterium]|nr:redox-sensing transcriptional repressor Rex [Thermoleophilia bacterium]
MPGEKRTEISRRTVKRLSLYRRLLDRLRASGVTSIYSHQLAHLAGVSAAQVRRDFMVIGYSGSPSRGYQLDTCLAAIEELLDGSTRQDVALVGLGRLGQSVLAHFAGRRPALRIAAGFDVDPDLIGRTIEGCPVYSIEDLERVISEKKIKVAILAVPPEKAQETADALVRAGVRSIVDFTAIPLRVPDDVFVDHMDITSALESAAFFARQEQEEETQDADTETDAGQSAVSGPMIRTIDDLLAQRDVRLGELASKIGARILAPGAGLDARITKIYAGDRVSDLLNEASASTLLITNLANVQMVRVADLMEVPGICFVDGVDPEPEVVELARENGILLMVSPVSVFETCGLIYQLLTTSQVENGTAASASVGNGKGLEAKDS